jgi:hypothetical protein
METAVRQIVFAIAVILVTASLARADILPPGAKWANHVAKFDGIAKHQADYVFYVYPRDIGRGQPGNSSVRVGESGEVGVSGLNPLAVAQAGGVFLFAIPKKLHGDEKAPKDEWFEGKGDGVLKAKLPFQPVRQVNKSDKRDPIVTKCKLEIKENKMTLAVVPEEKPTGKPGDVSTDVEENYYGSMWQWIVGGGATGLALMSGLWLAVRSGGKRNTPKSGQ